MKDFEIEDETYKNMQFLEGTHPLLTTDEPTSDKVVAFTHTYGKSPVVYIQLGHDAKAYANPSFSRLVAQSIRFVAGRLPDASNEGFVPLLNGKDGFSQKGPQPQFASYYYSLPQLQTTGSIIACPSAHAMAKPVWPRAACVCCCARSRSI